MVNTSLNKTRSDSLDDHIAIIGIGCRFPGDANDPVQLWNNLLAGLDSISEIPNDRWNISKFFHPKKGSLGKSATKWGGFVNDIDRFDAEFFGISPREAKIMDPQQRMLLEVCWEGLEDAGCVPSQWQGRNVGVFVGGFTLDYMLMQLGGADYRNVEPHTATGSMMTLLANRLSYIFGFQGPSLAVDTACSSSLVAVHLACRSLLEGESEMAIAGGVNALLGPSYTIAESRAGMLSPTGRSKAFDSRADGYVRGEGAGLVVLKTLSQAQADGDHIYAVIRATAVNQDGNSEGMTVPSSEAQMKLMYKALTQAEVEPRDLHYIEAHGTGTPVGDPIEALAIGTVASTGRSETNPCVVGSIKTNFGHTEAAAGVAGLIKAALVLNHRRVPPHLHFQRVNPKINLSALNLQIPSESLSLPAENTLYAAVNSFGFGGTNAHAILSSADVVSASNDESEQAPPTWILPISARHSDALPEVAGHWAQKLVELQRETGEQVNLLRDLCDSAISRREQHAYRACVVGNTLHDMVEGLQGLATEGNHHSVVTGHVAPQQTGLCFVYSGMGPQWWGMGQRLYKEEPVFAAKVDHCCELFSTLAGWSLFDAMQADEQYSRIADTEVAQPASFVLQVALTALLASWGIQPHTVVGHSAGEPAAAYVAGVLSLEEAILTIYTRSSLQQLTTGQGRLMAVGLSQDALLQQLAQLDQPSLSIAAINSPTAITVVGENSAISALKAQLDAQSVFARELRVSVPYHSVFMEPLEERVLQALHTLNPQPAKVPLYSTVTGQQLSGTEMTAEYWYKNIRQTVHFLAASCAIAEAGIGDFLEIGPHPVLSASLKETFADRNKEITVTTTLRRDTDEAKEMRHSIAALHVLGYSPDWHKLQGRGNWFRLPTYPWRTTRFWAETPTSQQYRLQAPEHTLLTRRLDLASPVWEVDLENPQLGFLEDHEIQGVVVFPGAGYIEMATHAARSLYGGLEVVEFQQVAFIKALYLSMDNPVTLRLAIDPATHQFTISSRSYGDENAQWQTHCTGTLCLNQTSAPSIAIEQLRLACTQEIPRAVCYQHFRSLGLEYGDTFQGISRLWQGDQQALTLLEAPLELQGTLANFNAHPALLDVCFQTLAAALPIKKEGSLVYMPVSVGQGRCYQPFSERMWIHARITNKDELGMSGDIVMFNEAGERVIDIVGCRARAMGGESNEIAHNTVAQKLYQPAWFPQSLNSEEIAATAQTGTWLIYGGNDALVSSTIQSLRDKGCGVLHIVDTAALANAVDTWVVNPTDQNAWVTILTRASVDNDLRGVLHLGSQGGQLSAEQARTLSAEQREEAIEKNCLTTLALCQALAATALPSRPRLWIVTRGTQQVDTYAVTNPLDAMVWGVGRVLGHGEHIDLWGGLIDLAAEADVADAEHLINELLYQHEEDHIAWRNQQRYVMRIQACAAETALPTLPVFRANASYLITGGLGALGLSVSRWMVERGARHLVLLGREALPPRNQWRSDTLTPTQRERIDAVLGLEAAGCSVRIEAVDISQLTQLTELLKRYDAESYPHIRGVIHSAGVAQPQLLTQMSLQDFMSVMPAKVQGAWCLHQAFLDRELDFFTLFSSVASVVVSMGQGNYAAANAGLDALAHWRRAQGLPALSINWGPWGDVGMATQLDLLKYFNSRGFFPMTAKQGCEALGQLLSGRTGQAVVLGARWQTVADTSPLGISAPLLRHLLENEQRESQESVAGQTQSQDFTSEYQACASADERQLLVEQHIHHLACQVLRIEGSTFSPTDTLTQLGMDSMMAIELKNRIERSLKVTVAIVDLLKGASIQAIAAMIMAEVDVIHSVVDQDLKDIMAELQNLPAEQIDSLLSSSN